ncbi:MULTISPECIES: FAD/NAD(P)-binding protein [Methylomicrobium]|uniref:FAD-dependent urate hydroxylase HpyO/Asp monooxygenase CreE-like FAD/NAD(P)-binding domain-containing protein n=1 Tax=Methylomicrobium album BG8 TaxID=686340 RepID=H8GGZ8_METAL|nr:MULTISPECIES: FAD/NAD(P)-binding protein [Methylomicrobium]EIC31273.1 hypothetical protein Metal_3626 [Methylomicrobium album BG8]
MPTQKDNNSFQKRTIVILGAGYSGTLTAVNILRQNTGDPVRLVLVERKAPFGRGLAYRTWDDNFVLNVPAGNMSALADDPDHFVNYCRNIDPAFNASSFIARRIYGDYLESTLAEAEKGSPIAVQKISGEALSVRPREEGGGFSVELEDSRSLSADQVVLALGHALPGNLRPAPDGFKPGNYIANPWDFAGLDRVDADKPILLLGSGHTAIDVLFRLTRNSNSGKVFLLSRRGLLPQGHRFTARPPVTAAFPAYLEEAAASCSVRAYMRALRREARRREAEGGNWRDAINELRPHTPEIWRRLPLTERRRFLVHVQAYWDIHRHRLAPCAHQRLHQMAHSGQAEIVAGKILSYRKEGDAVTVVVRPRHAETRRELTVGAMVNCTGPNYNLAASDIPLLAQLRDEGLIQQDPARIGLEVDDQYRVVGTDGQSVPDLFYIGPMLKARYWEAIAVPELRIHALRLAKLILSGSL